MTNEIVGFWRFFIVISFWLDSEYMFGILSPLDNHIENSKSNCVNKPFEISREQSSVFHPD